MLFNGYKKNDSVELSVVIPCYNSSESIMELHGKLINTLFNITTSYEIIYVNDCSTDDTIQKLHKFALEDENVIAVDLMFNVGQFRAIMCGLHLAKGSYVITMDDDLQHPPEDIRKLYCEIKNNNSLDAVIGVYEKKKHSFFRNIGTALVRKTIKYCIHGNNNIYVTSSFRCINRPLVNSINQHMTMFPSIGRLISRSSNRVKYIYVEHNERKHGKSNYTFLDLIRSYVSLLFNYTSIPLRIINATGIVLSIIGFLLAFYYIFHFFMNPESVPGWTTLVVLINIYSGFLLLSVGILGEYLLKTLQEVNGYPRYIVRSITHKEISID